MRGRDRWMLAGGALAAAVSVLAVGGVQRGTQGVVALITAAALLPLLVSKRGNARWSPLVVALGIATVLTALQLVPVPAGLAASLMPVGEALRLDGATVAGVTPWHGLSLDAPGTLRGLGMLLTLLGIAMVGSRASASARGKFWVCASIAALCAVTAIVVGVHYVTGATRLYGLYRPEQGSPYLLGPLLNGNHLGGLMATGCVVAIGLCAHRSQPSWVRAAWLLVACGCGFVAVATVSRGATLALAVGAAVTCALLIAQRIAGDSVPGNQRMRRTGFLTRSLPIGVVAACTLAVVVYTGASNVERQFDETSIREVNAPRSKFATWRSAIVLVRESPWVGVGRGAFESTITRVHPASASLTFSHVENEYLEALVDWGVPGAALLALAVAWLAAVAVGKWRDGPLVAGALGGIVVIAVQSNVDFGLELLGVAAPVTLLASTIFAPTLQTLTGRSLALARIGRVALIASLVLAAIVLQSAAATSIDEDHIALAARPGASAAEVRAVIQRHPLDYYGYARAVQVPELAAGTGSVRLLNHALRLHPTHPGLHHVAARLLRRAGSMDQAAGEYSEALRGGTPAGPLVREIVAELPADQAVAAIPKDYVDLDGIVTLLDGLKHPELATRWLLGVLAARPGTLHACELLYDLALREGDLDTTAKAAASCGDYESDRETRRGLALAWVKRGNDKEVVRLLSDVSEWSGDIDANRQAWLSLCEAHEHLGSWADAERCLRRLDVSSLVTPDWHADIGRRLQALSTAHRAATAAASAGSGSGSGSAH